MDLNLLKSIDIPKEFKSFVNGDWELASKLFASLLMENQKLKEEKDVLTKTIEENGDLIKYLERKMATVRISNDKLRHDLNLLEDEVQSQKKKDEEMIKLVKINENQINKIDELKLKINELEEDVFRFSTKSERIDAAIDRVLLNDKLISKEDFYKINTKKRKYEYDNSIVNDLKTKVAILISKNNILHKDNIYLRNQIRIFNYASKLNCVNSNKKKNIDDINLENFASFRDKFNFD